MAAGKESSINKEDIIRIVLEDLENNGPIMNILKTSFYCKIGEYDPAGHDEIKVLGWSPTSCRKCEKHNEFIPTQYLF